MEEMLIGPIGRLQRVPCPDVSLGWGSTVDSEVTSLLSGGRHVYRAPTSHRTYNVTWHGGTPELQPLMDVYNGVYGRGPFYMLDPNYQGRNILPPRWATPYLLAESVRGWANPSLVASSTALPGEAVRFSNDGTFEAEGPGIVVVAPDHPLSLRVWGSGGTVRVTRHSVTGWLPSTEYTPGAGAVEVHTPDPDVDVIRLSLHLPAGSTMTLDHINLTGEPGPRQPGTGVGPVQFTNTLGGDLQSTAFDRLGLSLDLTETE